MAALSSLAAILGAAGALPAATIIEPDAVTLFWGVSLSLTVTAKLKLPDVAYVLSP